MAITVTAAQAANQKAVNIINQWNQLKAQTASLLANGQPAQGNLPAFAGSDFTTALGADLAALNNAIAALS